jgi:rare lipoprotein A (peptidoglycan hydrolase)
MRFHFRKTATLFVLLATMSCTGMAGAVDAFAVTGGASAPAGSSSRTKPAKPKARRSAIATWFGPGFYGQKTACGQTLTPAVIGVAHRTLPCGTLVKLSYSGHTLTVPVLDRGPYSHIGADWDLTAAAAQALSIGETVRIRARIVGSAPNTPTLGLPLASAPAALVGGAVSG